MPRMPAWISRMRKPKPLRSSILTEIAHADALIKDPTTIPQRRAALEKWIKTLKTGEYGSGSTFLTERSRIEQRLARLSGDADAGQLPQMGTGGILLRVVGRWGLGKYLASRKRKNVITGIQTFIEAKPSDFKRLIFSTARFLLQNHELKKTMLYDNKAESEIYTLFGRIAEQNKNYSAIFPHQEKQSIESYGKRYFRHLIRNSVILDFKFLQHQHADPTRLNALKYALVGEEVNPLTERADLKRLAFITEVFGKDVPELDRFHQRKKSTGPVHQDRALQAIIRIRWKARNMLGTQEAVDFFREVCNYYNIKIKAVDDYATELYWEARHLPRPELKPTHNATQREAIVHERRLASVREKELIERIEDVWGRKTLEKYKPKENTAKEQPSKVILSPGADFELEVARRRKRKSPREIQLEKESADAKRKRGERAAKKIARSAAQNRTLQKELLSTLTDRRRSRRRLERLVNKED